MVGAGLVLWPGDYLRQKGRAGNKQSCSGPTPPHTTPHWLSTQETQHLGLTRQHPPAQHPAPTYTTRANCPPHPTPPLQDAWEVLSSYHRHTAGSTTRAVNNSTAANDSTAVFAALSFWDYAQQTDRALPGVSRGGPSQCVSSCALLLCFCKALCVCGCMYVLVLCVGMGRRHCVTVCPSHCWPACGCVSMAERVRTQECVPTYMPGCVYCV